MKNKNPKITGILKELAEIYKVVIGPQNQYRHMVYTKAATAVSECPHKIRSREDVLRIRRLPGGRTEGKTIDKVRAVLLACLHGVGLFGRETR